MTETKQDSKLKVGDSQTVTEDTGMTKEIMESVNKVHKYAITPPPTEERRKKGKYYYWKTYIPNMTYPQKREPIRAKTEEELYRKLATAYNINMDLGTTIEDMFFGNYNRELHSGTLEQDTYIRYVSDFKRYYAKTGWSVKDIRTLDQFDFAEFLEDSINGTLYPNTGQRLTDDQWKKHLRVITKGILKRARRKKLIGFKWEDVTDEMGKCKFAKSENKKADINHHEKELIIKYCEENPDPKTDCIRLMFMTGMRVGEATALKPQDLNMQNLTICICRTEDRATSGRTVKEKTKTEAGTRTIPIPKEFRSFFARLYWMSTNKEYVFMHDKRDKTRVRTASIEDKLHEICSKVGITPKTPQAIRRYYASVLRENGVPDTIIIALMGHTNIKTTEDYYITNISTTKETRDIIDRVVGL